MFGAVVDVVILFMVCCDDGSLPCLRPPAVEPKKLCKTLRVRSSIGMVSKRASSAVAIVRRSFNSDIKMSTSPSGSSNIAPNLRIPSATWIAVATSTSSTAAAAASSTLLLLLLLLLQQRPIVRS